MSCWCRRGPLTLKGCLQVARQATDEHQGTPYLKTLARVHSATDASCLVKPHVTVQTMLRLAGCSQLTSESDQRRAGDVELLRSSHRQTQRYRQTMAQYRTFTLFKEPCLLTAGSDAWACLWRMWMCTSSACLVSCINKHSALQRSAFNLEILHEAIKAHYAVALSDRLCPQPCRTQRFKQPLRPQPMPRGPIEIHCRMRGRSGASML